MVGEKLNYEKCPGCGERMKYSDATVLEKNKAGIEYGFSCNNCKQSFVRFVEK